MVARAIAIFPIETAVDLVPAVESLTTVEIPIPVPTIQVALAVEQTVPVPLAVAIHQAIPFAISFAVAVTVSIPLTVPPAVARSTATAKRVPVVQIRGPAATPANVPIATAPAADGTAAWVMSRRGRGRVGGIGPDREQTIPGSTAHADQVGVPSYRFSRVSEISRG